MKITRFPQSCLKVEEGGRTLLIDVGALATPHYKLEDFGAFDAVLFTHSHGDHFDVKFLPQLAATEVAIYGNVDVAAKAGDTKVEVVEDQEELVIAGFKVRAINLEHCLMTDGSPAGIPNTGFLVNEHLLIPGDSTDDPGVEVDILAVPIFGPDISPKDAYLQMVATKAKKVLPVHYDVAGIDPKVFEHFAALTGGELPEIITLDNGQSAEF